MQTLAHYIDYYAAPVQGRMHLYIMSVDLNIPLTLKQYLEIATFEFGVTASIAVVNGVITPRINNPANTQIIDIIQQHHNTNAGVTSKHFATFERINNVNLPTIARAIMCSKTVEDMLKCLTGLEPVTIHGYHCLCRLAGNVKKCKYYHPAPTSTLFIEYCSAYPDEVFARMILKLEADVLSVLNGDPCTYFQHMPKDIVRYVLLPMVSK